MEESVKVIYDPEADVLRIVLINASIEESDEDKPGVILDNDKDGNIVGLEILEASKRVSNPRSVEYAVAGQGSNRASSLIVRRRRRTSCSRAVPSGTGRIHEGQCATHDCQGKAAELRGWRIAKLCGPGTGRGRESQSFALRHPRFATHFL